MKGNLRNGFRRLGSHLLANDQAAIGAILVAIVPILVIVGLIFLILTIVANIIPLIIFLVLAIVFALIIKHFIFGRGSLGVTRGVLGITRAAGREFVPVAKQAGGTLGRLIGK